jgi:hypothetical protein
VREKGREKGERKGEREKEREMIDLTILKLHFYEFI